MSSFSKKAHKALLLRCMNITEIESLVNICHITALFHGMVSYCLNSRSASNA